MKKMVLSLLVTGLLFSCSNSNDKSKRDAFSGSWKCDGNGQTFQFIKINESTYTLRYPKNDFTVRLIGEGSVQYNSFIFSIDQNTGKLIMPQGYNSNCATARKIK